MSVGLFFLRSRASVGPFFISCRRGSRGNAITHFPYHLPLTLYSSPFLLTLFSYLLIRFIQIFVVLFSIYLLSFILFFYYHPPSHFHYLFHLLVLHPSLWLSFMSSFLSPFIILSYMLLYYTRLLFPSTLFSLFLSFLFTCSSVTPLICPSSYSLSSLCFLFSSLTLRLSLSLLPFSCFCLHCHLCFSLFLFPYYIFYSLSIIIPYETRPSFSLSYPCFLFYLSFSLSVLIFSSF